MYCLNERELSFAVKWAMFMIVAHRETDKVLLRTLETSVYKN